MATTFSLLTGRPLAAQADRRGLRLSAKQCLARCESQCQDAAPSQPSAAKLILPGLLAAALLHTSAAHAGVVLEKAVTKKVYQGQKAAERAKQQAEQTIDSAKSGGGFSLPSFSAPSLPSLPGLPTPSLPGLPKAEGIEFDAKTIALPGAIGFIAFVAFAASKFDSGLGAFMNESMVKDSTNFAGYEEDLKGSPVGFLGLGNLDVQSIPGGAALQEKIRGVVGGPDGAELKKGKGTQGIVGASPKKELKKGKKGGKGGLFGFGK